VLASFGQIASRAVELPTSTPQRICADASKVAAMPVLGRIHHDYRAAA
jgi:hypothetical protein